MKLLISVCLLLMYLHASKGADSPPIEDGSPASSGNPSFPKYVTVDREKLDEQFSHSPQTRPIVLPKSTYTQNKEAASQTK